jgi:hypothetical protein
MAGSSPEPRAGEIKPFPIVSDSPGVVKRKLSMIRWRDYWIIIHPDEILFNPNIEIPREFRQFLFKPDTAVLLPTEKYQA